MAIIALLRQKERKGTGIRGYDSEGKPALFLFDATLSESHNYSAEITMNPVEQGSDITDHIKLSPVEITIQGVISETPLDLERQVRGLVTAGISRVTNPIFGAATGSFVGLMRGDSNRVKNAFDSFIDTMNKRIPFDVRTGLKEYQNMVIKSLVVNRDNNTGQVLDFTITMQQITIVQSAVITIPKTPAGVNAAKRANTGQQAQKNMTESNKTLAATLFDSAFGSN